MTPQEALKKYFGYDSFRKGQQEIIDNVLNHRDVLAIMPTGAGKSLCYQIPAVIMSGLTIVISPLISLIQDQVQSLNEVGIPAAYISSSINYKKAREVYEKAAEGEYKLLYIAPERLRNDTFINFAQNTDVSMVIVDEAHCISQWGQDFRPVYLEIVSFVKNLPNRPIVGAFTATATENVKNDILCILGLEDPYIISTGFDRPNLAFSVEFGNRDEFIKRYVTEHSDESGIIYCATRKLTEKVCDNLIAAGVNAVKYHAGLGQAERRENQENFVRDKIGVMVATNAFGMGIDKSNVRYVIHYNMPLSIEDYYQEAGRAGRDGLPSQCILLYSKDAIAQNINLIDYTPSPAENEEIKATLRDRSIKRLYRMADYCQCTECLRNNILNYFGEKAAEPCGRCSNCTRPIVEKNVTEEARAIIKCVAESGQKYGKNKIVGILTGSNSADMKEINANSLESFGKLKGTDKDYLKKIIDQMINENVLLRVGTEYPIVNLGPGADSVEEENGCFKIKVHEQEIKTAVKESKTTKKSYFDELTSAGKELFDELRKLRMEIAQSENIAPFIVFADTSLLDMCIKLPGNKEDMLNVKGVGNNKCERYGERFAAVISKFINEHPDTVISTYEEPEEQRSEKKEETANSRYRLPRSEAQIVHDAACKRVVRMMEGLGNKEKSVEEMLMKLEKIRIDAAALKQQSYDEILYSRTLQDVARKMPKSREDLKLIAGMNDERIAEYGDKILAIVGETLRIHPELAVEEKKEKINAEAPSENMKRCEGLTFAVTGKLFVFENRNAFGKYVASQGGTLSGSVSGRTDYLVNNDNMSNSTKNKNAHALNVPIITEAEFIERFGKC